MMISSLKGYPLPQIIDDEYLLGYGEGNQPSNTESSMSLFIYSIRLFDILPGILSTFYTKHDTTCSIGKVKVHGWSDNWLQDIWRYNKSLEELRDSLPDRLKMSYGAQDYSAGTQSPDDNTQLLRNVFHSRCVHYMSRST